MVLEMTSPASRYARSLRRLRSRPTLHPRLRRPALARAASNRSYPQPADKGLRDPLAGTPATEELGQTRRGEFVRRNRRQEGKHGLVLTQVDVGHLLYEADMPTSGGAGVFVGLLISEEERQFERLRQGDELELRRCRERFGDSAAVQSSAEAHVGRALGGHEPKPLAWPAAGEVNLLPPFTREPPEPQRAFTRLLRPALSHRHAGPERRVPVVMGDLRAHEAGSAGLVRPRTL